MKPPYDGRKLAEAGGSMSRRRRGGGRGDEGGCEQRHDGERGEGRLESTSSVSDVCPRSGQPCVRARRSFVHMPLSSLTGLAGGLAPKRKALRGDHRDSPQMTGSPDLRDMWRRFSRKVAEC